MATPITAGPFNFNAGAAPVAKSTFSEEFTNQALATANRGIGAAAQGAQQNLQDQTARFGGSIGGAGLAASRGITNRFADIAGQQAGQIGIAASQAKQADLQQQRGIQANLANSQLDRQATLQGQQNELAQRNKELELQRQLAQSQQAFDIAGGVIKTGATLFGGAPAAAVSTFGPPLLPGQK